MQDGLDVTRFHLYAAKVHVLHYISLMNDERHI
jgi:hypothetical protein